MKILLIRVKKTLHNTSKSESHAHRAYTFYELNRYKECIQEAEKALSYDPELEPAWTLLILGNSMLKNTDLAIELGDEALKIQADSAEIHYAIGTAYLRGRQPYPAVSHLQIAVQKHPLASGYLVNLGIAYWSLNKKEKALACLNKALSLDPKNNYALNLKSQLQKDQKNVVEALGTINKALRISPDDADNHLVKGEFEMAQGNYETATNHFQEALRLNPTDIKARTALIECLFLSNKTHQILNRTYPSPYNHISVHLLVLVFGVMIFNYYAGKDSISTPPQIWVWILLFPFVFFWIAKPYLKLNIYQERFGEHELEDTDPALPITFGAAFVVILMIAYALVRNDFLAWWSGGLAMLIAIVANVLISENPSVGVPVFKNPWTSFWYLFLGSGVVMFSFYRLSLM
ncbi:MAG: tetratricopeptide repeat protein [Bacteroidetes bacterium]|jgi:tetratricopeptide (TPR) repeat protein|nr:tetratricopeptide repeat protein [Bacteroidota bacterium]MDF1867433.1 tetratricopeptide repeat protein [Saprospiraceae bacterium]